MMDYEDACTVVEKGRYFYKENKFYFFAVNQANSQEYLVYYRDQRSKGQSYPKGHFSLEDVSEALWDGSLHQIHLQQSSKIKVRERMLADIPQDFFEALIVVTQGAVQIHHEEFTVYDSIPSADQSLIPTADTSML